MKGKILLTVLCIGIMSVSAIFHADLARSAPAPILSDQEMVQTFGKSCTPCTLGEDVVVAECLNEGECNACNGQTVKVTARCGSEEYPEGNYIYTCKDTGVTDGHCYEGQLIDCKREYDCDINGSWYEDYFCENSGHLCKDEGTGTPGCVNCEKGDPKGDAEDQRDWVCSCP